jgi:NADPH-dependent 2,4-dienoyl-CoA reductase/sulfur reductase-like enzyme
VKKLGSLSLNNLKMVAEITTPPTKGRIIVVGAGYAGLATAIELTRKGFSVEVLEAAKKLTTQGQEVSLTPL